MITIEQVKPSSMTSEEKVKALIFLFANKVISSSSSLLESGDHNVLICYSQLLEALSKPHIIQSLQAPISMKNYMTSALLCFSEASEIIINFIKTNMPDDYKIESFFGDTTKEEIITEAIQAREQKLTMIQNIIESVDLEEHLASFYISHLDSPVVVDLALINFKNFSDS
jgi:hypothetical protein